MGFMTSPSQAWAILSRHAKEEIEPLRLHQLLRDNDRVSALVAVYNTSFEPSSIISGKDDNYDTDQKTLENRMLIVDLSRQRMTVDTVNHLLNLAKAKDLRKYILQLAWGQNDHKAPIRNGSQEQQQQQQSHGRVRHAAFSHDSPATLPSMHLALRAPVGSVMLLADGTNALPAIHREWDRLERLSESIRRGQLRGVTGSLIRDVILIGRGTPVAALQFVYTALLKDERAVLATRFGLVEPAAARIRRNLTGGSGPSAIPGRTLRFLTTIDPIAAAAAVTDLDPASTLVISLALNGNEETGLATKTIKTWLLQGLGSTRRADQILSKHMLLVTGNDHIVSVINKPERVHIVPEHSRCEAFTTFSPAGLLPLSVVFGWALVEEFIQGAHDMDKHFVETNPRHNLPILLALTDIWNDILLGASARIVAPFTDALACYPQFTAAIESQTCCRQSQRNSDRLGCPSIIVDAGLGGMADRAVYQSTTRMNTEIITTMDSQLAFNTARALGLNSREEIQSAEDSLMCSLFAHADELALGNQRPGDIGGSIAGSPVANPITPTEDIIEGNRPSLLLMTGKLDAFACGQLVAVTEHRALVKAVLCEFDPFVREPGSSLRMHRTDTVREELQQLYLFKTADDEDEDDDDGSHDNNERLNLSTKTLLQHYAMITRNERPGTASRR